MTGDVVPAPQQGVGAAAARGHGAPPGDPMDVECPICYQEYNHHNKSPRMLECLHVFCSECLQRIQLCPREPADPHSAPAIPCPLCRHLTPLEAAGDALSLPRSSHVLARLPPVAFRLPVTVVTHIGHHTVTQRVALSRDGNTGDSHFTIIPTISLRVQQMHPYGPCSPGTAPGRTGEEGVVQQSKRILSCVRLLAVIFWVLFMFTCVGGLAFGAHLLRKPH